MNVEAWEKTRVSPWSCGGDLLTIELGLNVILGEDLDDFGWLEALARWRV